MLVAAMGCLVVTVVACVATVAALHARAEPFLPWFGIGGMIVFYVFLFLGFRTRPATIEVDGGQVRVSWRAEARRVARVAPGRWVLGGIDTPMGMLLEIGDDRGGRLRVGGEAHDGRGYANEAPARRSVDIAVGADDFDRIAATLGVARTRAAPALELVRSSQSAGGLLGTMAPWLLTIVVVSALGVTLGVTGLGDAVSPLVLGGGTMAIVLLGLIVTVVRSNRVRAPALVLQADEAALLITERGETTAHPWSAVRAEARQHVVRMKGSSWTMPALALALGDRTLELVAWGGKADWPGPVPSLRRAPRWLAGMAQFEAFLSVLRDRRMLSG